MKQERTKKHLKWGNAIALLGIAALLAVTGCGGGEPKKEGGTAPSAYTPPIYSMYQQIFCLNMLSDISAMFNGNKDQVIGDSTAYAIDTILSSPLTMPLIGHWKSIWGPVVSASLGKERNTMFMAQNLDSPSLYVIAIAGTDFQSIYDWFYEDFNVKNVRYWSEVLKNVSDTTWSPTPNMDTPFVSAATARGLADIMALADTRKAGAPTLMAFIKHLSDSLAKTSTPNMTIWTTGHSLGGALSPALACYLWDTKAAWASTNTISMNCLGVAGATPGNSPFTAHYLSSVPNTIRVWNAKDVVPHGFEPDMMIELNTIYDSNNVKTPPLVRGIVNTWSKDLQNKKIYYYQLYPTQDTVFESEYYHDDNAYPGTKGKPDKEFLDQLLCQHVPSYPHYFGVDTFQTYVKNIMKFENPFFSGGYKPAPILSVQHQSAPSARK